MKSLILYFTCLLSVLLWSGNAFAQTSSTQDSLKAVRIANQQRIDSVKQASKLRADSLAALKKYRSSKRYADSLADIRQEKLLIIAAERARIMDSIRAVRKVTQDSLKAIAVARRNYVDSVNAVKKAEAEALRAARQKVSDSLARIREYKLSKTYKDSMMVIRQARIDSLKAVRLAYNDSVRTAQRKVLDSIAAERKRTNDSLRSVQKAIFDSLRAERMRVTDSMRSQMDSIRTAMAQIRDSAAATRKVISDSLAQVRAERAKAREVAVKEKEKKKKLALEIKLDQQKQAFTNEKHRKKRWSFVRKNLQNTVTRYNYYYNANQKLKEAELNIVRSKKDNFDQLLPLFPFDPDVDSAKLKSDMDTLIQKTSLGIQLHDPRSKWQDDLYLIMGQAYYYKGDYVNAANAFKFIIHEADKQRKEEQKKKKTDKKDPLLQNQFAEIEPEGLAAIIKHNPSKNEAILWLARILVKQKDVDMAQLLLDMLKNDVNFPKNLKGRLYLEYAHLALATEKYQYALASLDSVLHASNLNKYFRLRAGYIRGQILQKNNELEESSTSFEKVVALFPPLEMDFNARMNIVKNSLQTTEGTIAITSTLEKMANDQKFKSYFDQVYYSLAKSYEISGQTDKAIDFYNKSLAQNSNNALQKGLSYNGLGDLYYSKKQHIIASEKYDSAIQFLTSFDEPYYSNASKRAASLYQLAVPAGRFQETDSLIRLSALPESAQKAHIQQYLKELEKARIAEYYASLKAPEASTANPMGNKSWYFSNTAMMQKGSQEFKQKWPNRELKDNWRRSTLTSSSFTEDDNIVEENLTPEENIRRNLPSEDSLFAAIPRNPIVLDSLNIARKEALISLGKNYFYVLEDYSNTFNYIDILDSLYPKNEYQPETFYIRYLIKMRQQLPDEAKKYQQLLTENYPNSNWTSMMNNAGNPGNDSSMRIDAHYDNTYNIVMNGEYANGIQLIEQAYSQFPTLGSYKKQYDILRILSYAGTKEYAKAETMVAEWLSMNSNDSLRDYVLTLKNYIEKNKALLDTLNNDPNDSVKVATGAIDNEGANNTPNKQSEIFGQANKNSKHYVIIMVPLDARIQGLKAGLSEYNRITPGNENIVVTLNALTRENSLILSREFQDNKAAKEYLNKVQALSSLFGEYPNKQEYQLATISVENYPKLLSSKDFKSYMSFWKKNYK